MKKLFSVLIAFACPPLLCMGFSMVGLMITVALLGECILSAMLRSRLK